MTLFISFRRCRHGRTASLSCGIVVPRGTPLRPHGQPRLRRRPPRRRRMEGGARRGMGMRGWMRRRRTRRTRGARPSRDRHASPYPQHCAGRNSPHRSLLYAYHTLYHMVYAKRCAPPLCLVTPGRCPWGEGDARRRGIGAHCARRGCSAAVLAGKLRGFADVVLPLPLSLQAVSFVMGSVAAVGGNDNMAAEVISACLALTASGTFRGFSGV